MKFGQKLEQESVPEWSIHNVDYNSLKYEIKIHTRRDQARAITIPGHSDAPLRKFEDNFYAELCRQHDRVDMFVGSKAAEVSTRLEYLSRSIERLASRSARARVTLRMQKRLVKYQHELLRCGDAIQALNRFTRAQMEAFRKILKKYKRWTGSAALGDRFREHILGDPKSFTRRDFTHLRTTYDETRAALNAVLTNIPSEPTSPESNVIDSPTTLDSTFSTLPSPQVEYWNEYDHGSDAGGSAEHNGGGYALYINPDEEAGFPGWRYVSAPFSRAKSWLLGGGDRHHATRGETAPLLSSDGGASYSSRTFSAGVSRPVSSSTTDGGGTAAYSSSSEDDLPRVGYRVHYVSPTLEVQRLMHHRAAMLLWSTVACLAAAGVFAAVAGVLLLTGRTRNKAEVEAGTSVGLAASLFAACAAVGLDMVARRSWWWRAVVWVLAGAVLVLDGMLLILVAEG